MQRKPTVVHFTRVKGDLTLRQMCIRNANSLQLQQIHTVFTENSQCVPGHPPRGNKYSQEQLVFT
jgi:hypothetical protein